MRAVRTTVANFSSRALAAQLQLYRFLSSFIHNFCSVMFVELEFFCV